MNSLSLVLYFADIAENIRGLFIFLMICMGLLTGGLIILCLVSRVACDWEGDPVKIRYPIYASVFFFLFAMVQISIPSKDTIYLIAGSEIGEQVVKSPEAQQMFEDIREVIKGQLNKLKETK